MRDRVLFEESQLGMVRVPLVHHPEDQSVVELLQEGRRNVRPAVVVGEGEQDEQLAEIRGDQLDAAGLMTQELGNDRVDLRFEVWELLNQVEH